MVISYDSICCDPNSFRFIIHSKFIIYCLHALKKLKCFCVYTTELNMCVTFKIYTIYMLCKYYILYTCSV